MSIFSVNIANTGKNNKITNKIHGGGAYYTNKIVQKCLSFAVSLFLIFCTAPQKALGLENHTVDANGNWTINNVQGMVEFRDEVNGGNDFSGKTVTLAADIDLSSVCSESLGSWVPIGVSESTSFAGTFDGACHTISGIYINDNSLDYIGLFGNSCGTTTNCVVANSTVSGNKTYGYTGSICGKCYSYSAKIINCVVKDCTISGNSDNNNNCGGICGACGEGAFVNVIVTNCNISNGNFFGATGFDTWFKYCFADVVISNFIGVSDNVTWRTCYYVTDTPYDNGLGLKGVSRGEYNKALRTLTDELETAGTAPAFVNVLKTIVPPLKTLHSSDFVFTLPEDLDYDGQGKTITIKPKDGITEEMIGTVTVKYYKVNSDNTLGAASTTPPTDAGRYKVKFDVSAGTEYGAATDLPAMF